MQDTRPDPMALPTMALPMALPWLPGAAATRPALHYRRPEPKIALASTTPVRASTRSPPFADSEAHMSEPLASRITWNPQQCGGKPCIRGMRIRVSDVLELLAQGVSEPTILADFPDLQPEDIRACLHFAALRTDLERLVA